MRSVIVYSANIALIYKCNDIVLRFSVKVMLKYHFELFCVMIYTTFAQQKNIKALRVKYIKIMAHYIETLLTEKNISLETSLLENEDNIGLTVNMLIDFIYSTPNKTIKQIEATIRKIDFVNGDVMHYVGFLAKGMIQATNN